MRVLLPGSSAVKPVIGMLHLLPLAGSPLFGGDRGAVRRRVLEDAKLLVAGGVHGLMIENFGDVPFYPDDVPAHVVADVAALAMLVREAHPRVPLGINVLRNDALAAMSVAAAVGASSVRVNVLTGARLTDQGMVQGRAAELLRLRQSLGAVSVSIWADVDVKHSAPIATRPLADEVDDVLHRGLADALIVSGAGTGKPTEPAKAAEVHRAAKGRAPVLIGAGATATSLATLAPHCDGFIVGTSMKIGGNPTAAVDPHRVAEVMAAWAKL